MFLIKQQPYCRLTRHNWEDIFSLLFLGGGNTFSDAQSIHGSMFREFSPSGTQVSYCAKDQTRPPIYKACILPANSLSDPSIRELKLGNITFERSNTLVSWNPNTFDSVISTIEQKLESYNVNRGHHHWKILFQTYFATLPMNAMLNFILCSKNISNSSASCNIYCSALEQNPQLLPSSKLL